MNSRAFQQTVSWVLVALVIFFLYRVTKPFLAALTWAAILTIFFFPAHRLVRRHVRWPNLAAVATTSAVTVLLVAPVVWLVPAFAGEAVHTVSSLPSRELLPRVRVFLEEYAARSPIPLGNFEEMVQEASRKGRALLAQYSARFAGGIAEFLLDGIVMIMAMFYLFRDGPGVVALLKDVSPFGGEHRDRMMREVADLVSVTISSGLAVALVQGLLGGLTFLILGLPSPLFWGVITGLLAFLPVVGPWLVWGPAGVGLLLSGSTGKGVALLILGFVLVSGADNVLRPLLIAGRSQLNGLLVFISLLGGIQAFGLLGVVLGPLVVATAVGLLRGYRESLREQSLAPASPEAA